MSESRSTFEHAERDGAATLVVSGELDLASRDDFREALSELVARAHSPAIVNLTAVSFIDSSGLGELVRAQESAKMLGIDLVLVSPPRQAMRVFELSGLAQMFTIRDS